MGVGCLIHILPPSVFYIMLSQKREHCNSPAFLAAVG